MALPSSGQITLNQVNVELGNSGSAQIDMNDAAVRGLFGIASGEIEMSDGYGKSNVAWYGDRGMIAGGAESSGYYVSVNYYQYYSIPTTGGAADFGDMVDRAAHTGSCSDGSRGVTAGGIHYNSQTYAWDIIGYVTIATTGNATDFGNLIARDYSVTGLSNGPRGVFAGGRDRPGLRNFTNVISYITIQTPSNASDFGDLVSADSSNFWANMAGCSNGTRGVFGGGGAYSQTNIIQYITIATTGNATDFGDLTASIAKPAGFNGGDRGIFAGGETSVGRINTIEQISIPTTGNATDFGDLTVAMDNPGASSNDTYGVIHGGYNVNTMNKLTIATGGNAIDWGDMVVGLYGTSGFSGD